MKTWLRMLGIGLAMALITSAAAAETQKLKVLVIAGGHGFQTNQFLKVFADNPGIVFSYESHRSKTNATVFERADLLTFDVVVLYDMPGAITDAQKARFMSLTDKGTGLVVLHHAIVSYQGWPEYERIIGGRYPEPPGQGGKVTEAFGYQHDVQVPVVVTAKDHPVTKGVKDFTIHDEIYWGVRVGADVTPLITTTHPKSMKPLGWTRTEGKSRVVYLQLGHDKWAFEDPNYCKLVTQALAWAGGK